MPRVTLSFKGTKISTTLLQQEAVILGRDGDCTIVVDSLAIAPKHLKISHSRGNYVVTALNEQFPLILNYKKIECATLKHGDLLQVGKHSLNFIHEVIVSNISTPNHIPNIADLKQVESSFEEDSEQDLTGILQILSGSNIGRVIPLNRPLVKIGRSGKECAVVAHRKSGYHISFLEGDNPLIVNKKPITDQSHLLKNGDQIEFGDTSMYFQEAIKTFSN